VVLGATGCETLQSFDMTYFQSSAAGRERVVAGSVESVARSAEGVLHGLGLQAVVSKEGEVVRIRSQTLQGQKFALVCARASDGKTRVRIEWDGTADEGMGYALLAQLDLLLGQ
jgi:hypothetical protein